MVSDEVCVSAFSEEDVAFIRFETVLATDLISALCISEEVLDSVVSDGISFHPSSGINPLEEDISFPPEDEFPIPFLHPAKDTVSSKLKSKAIAFFM